MRGPTLARPGDGGEDHISDLEGLKAGAPVDKRRRPGPDAVEESPDLGGELVAPGKGDDLLIDRLRLRVGGRIGAAEDREARRGEVGDQDTSVLGDT